MTDLIRTERGRKLASAAVSAIVTGVFTIMVGSAANADAGSEYASPDRPGPPLSVPADELARSLSCSSNMADGGREPVLLIPGTTSNPERSFGWNLLPAFEAQGIPYCAVTLPSDNDLDIQINAEYVVSAVRAMHAAAGRKVQIVGWSQGAGPMPRWALRWWPDIRPMVDNLVGLDPDNRGTATLDMFGCGVVNALCAPAIWQQRPGSNFVRALNSGPMTFPELNYTVIYTRIDNFVLPSFNGEAQKLPVGPNVTNISIQDFCGSLLAGVPEHSAVVGSPITYAMVMDVLAHPGTPLDPSRVDPQVCGQVNAPYADAATQAGGVLDGYLGTFGEALPRDGGAPGEPPLRCYIYDDGRRPPDCAG